VSVVASRRAGRWEATFSPTPDSARLARVALAEALKAASLPSEAISNALLVLGELVSNAIRHARTEFRVTALVEAGALRIEVLDYDTRPPALMGLDEESTSGRGLHMVAGIATDWGWNTAEGDGESAKVVWAELEFEDPGSHGA
jgi:anti-sigma regulatory factor (Ser/Thr protein kinase)